MKQPKITPGAVWKPGGVCQFRVWAPLLKKVQLVLPKRNQTVPMRKDKAGYWSAELTDIQLGERYLYDLEGSRQRPDPASYCQPDGVHHASAVVDHTAFEWNDADWKGVPLEEMNIYELHVGTFTKEGMFESILSRVDELLQLGINAIELMPVAQFPGTRNWGYDGVYPYAVQDSYGGVNGLKHLVNECHQRGMAVILDVVYNHLGPEGNYLWDYGPYFTDHYHTPWNSAVNFDGNHSGGVRNYFIQNAVYWMEQFHIDALRLDALHAVYDFGAKHILLELSETVRELGKRDGRPRYLIAETSLNDARLIEPPKRGGYNLDAQWNDEFHHALRTLLTGDKREYYADFGKTSHLAKAFRQGYVYDGQYSEFRKRNHGNSPKKCPASQFVVFSQNHDQVGNRMKGDRPSEIVPFDALEVMAGAVVLAPSLPMLFMGEEYGETRPFPYFISHGDPDLVEAVREGRKREFSEFHEKGMGEPPDPQAEETFQSAILSWRRDGQYGVLLEFYRELFRIRKDVSVFRELGKLFPRHRKVKFSDKDKTLSVHLIGSQTQTLAVFNFHPSQTANIPIPSGAWQKRIDSQDIRWNGAGFCLPERIDANTESLQTAPLTFAFFAR